jgi:hypothetical protein
MIRNLIGKNELLELREEWKIKATQLIYKSNRSIDNNEIEKLRAESDGMYTCINDLFYALTGERPNAT